MGCYIESVYNATARLSWSSPLTVLGFARGGLTRVFQQTSADYLLYMFSVTRVSGLLSKVPAVSHKYVRVLIASYRSVLVQHKHRNYWAAQSCQTSG